MLPLEGSKEGWEKRKGSEKNCSPQIQSQNNQGTLQSSDLRRPSLSQGFSFLPLAHHRLLTFHHFTSNATGQPFLLTSYTLHPLPLERCKVNISIGLQWPVSAALIPTLLFESSIVPDLLAWFACLWIMAREPLSGLLPSTPFLLIWSSKHILYDSGWYIPLCYGAARPLPSNGPKHMAISAALTQVFNPSLHPPHVCKFPSCPHAVVWTEASNTKKWQLQFCCARQPSLSSITPRHDKSACRLGFFFIFGTIGGCRPRRLRTCRQSAHRDTKSPFDVIRTGWAAFLLNGMERTLIISANIQVVKSYRKKHWRLK